jgi:hypothetical protein
MKKKKKKKKEKKEKKKDEREGGRCLPFLHQSLHSAIIHVV